MQRARFNRVNRVHGSKGRLPLGLALVGDDEGIAIDRHPGPVSDIVFSGYVLVEAVAGVFGFRNGEGDVAARKIAVFIGWNNVVVAVFVLAAFAVLGFNSFTGH